MLEGVSRIILYKLWGFREDVTEVLPAKCVIALAPHTSNWDFLVGQLYCRAAGFHCNFMMKKEWFFWPLGLLFRHLGGVPVHRDKQRRTTDIVASKALEMDTFRMCITPEGTRKSNPDWKKGFYYIALKANIPILLYGLDYEKKVIYCHRTFLPTGDVEQDMLEVKKYFSEFKGKHPEKFAL